VEDDSMTALKVRTVLIGSARAGHSELLDMLLVSGGFDVVHRKDGQEVLEFLKDNTPDAVVLDIDLPNADGREICSRVRSIRRLCDVVVVLLTPTVLELGGAENFRATVRSTSADLVLPEPIGDKNLVGRLQNLFLEREEFSSNRQASSFDVGLTRTTTRRARSASTVEREAMTVASLEDEVRVLRAQLKAYQRRSGSERASRDFAHPPDPGHEWERTVAELKEQNVALLRDLERQRATEGSRVAEMEELQSRLAERQSEIVDLERHAESLSNELAQRATVESDLRRELTASQESLAKQEQDVVDLMRRLDALTEALAEQEAAGASARHELAAAQARVGEREQEIDGLKRRNEMLLQELERRRAEEAPLREFFQRILQAEQATGHYGKNRAPAAAGNGVTG
jgi:DNA-binding response OmpR family regulator